MSLAVGSARTLALRLLNVAVQVPTSILLARLLGVQGKGAYTLLTVIPWLTAFLFLLGQDTAVTWLLSGRQGRLRPLVVHAIGFVLVVSPLAAATYLWLVAPRVLAGLPVALVTTSALLIPLVLARCVLLGIMLGYERVVGFNAYYLVCSMLVLVLVALLVGVLGRGLSGALAAFVIAQAAMIPIGAAWIARFAAGVPDPGPAAPSGAPLVRRNLTYGLKGHLASTLVTFNQRFDIILLGALSNTTQIGLYGVAVSMAEAISHIPMSIHLNLFPRVSAEGSEAGARRLPRAFRMTVLLSSALALGLLVLGRPLIGLLYGAPFLPAFRSLALLLPGVVAMGCATVFESYFAGVNRRQYQSYSVALSFALALGLGWWLIPLWGAAGAAIASTASYLLQMVVSIALGRRAAAPFGREYLAFGIGDLRELSRAARSVLGIEGRAP